MVSILVVVGLIVVAFFVALINGKSRQKNTTTDIRIVHGSNRKFNKKTNSWPEELGEIVTLHLNENFLDGHARVISIKENTLPFATDKPYLCDGEEKTHFVLCRDSYLTLIPIDEEDKTPYHISFARMIMPVPTKSDNESEGTQNQATKQQETDNVETLDSNAQDNTQDQIELETPDIAEQTTKQAHITSDDLEDKPAQ